MKNIQIIFFIAIILLLGVGIYFTSKISKAPTTVSTDNIEEPEDVAVESVLGCYVSRTGNDVYTLNIQNQTGENVSGALAFKNYQKDSSSGTFDGTYKDGILLGDYSFQSEGMFSVMQVIFKKMEGGFVRGYGEVNDEGTRFVDVNNINYDASSSLNVFKKEPCPAQ